MKEFLEEILVENADMSLHGKVQEYLQSIMEVDFRTSGSEENIKGVCRSFLTAISANV